MAVKFQAKLTREEQELLKTLRQIEDGAQLVKGALSVGVFKDLIIGKPEEKLRAITDTDWDLFVNALKAANKIHMCKSEEAINLYLLDHNGAWPSTEGTRVLQAMFQVYSAGCK